VLVRLCERPVFVPPFEQPYTRGACTIARTRQPTNRVGSHRCSERGRLRISLAVDGPFFPPGVLTDFWDTWEAVETRHVLSPLHPGLWLAGADYAARGNGYIDGAIASGKTAASRILDRARSW
jgi:hypothetical protein